MFGLLRIYELYCRCQSKTYLNTLFILFTICALAWHGRPVLQKYKAARGLAVKDIACAKWRQQQNQRTKMMLKPGKGQVHNFRSPVSALGHLIPWDVHWQPFIFIFVGFSLSFFPLLIIPLLHSFPCNIHFPGTYTPWLHGPADIIARDWIIKG